jgi:hypothetical protein
MVHDSSWDQGNKAGMTHPVHNEAAASAAAHWEDGMGDFHLYCCKKIWLAAAAVQALDVAAHGLRTIYIDSVGGGLIYTGHSTDSQ